MKFRTFITTLVLFLIILFSSLFLISLYMMDADIDNINQRGLSEHYFITSAFGKDLTAVVGRGNTLEDSIEPLYEFYTELYKKQGVYLEIRNQGEVMFSNFNYLNSDAKKLNPGTRKASFVRFGGATYIHVTGELPGTDNKYELNYLHDITGNLAAWQQMQKILLLIGIISSTVLAICLELLLSRVFKPLNMVSETSKNIAAGQYENRIKIKGQNELSEMAQSFNYMAEEIQSHITQLAEASEQKQQFVDNFAHEIRTPLTSVYGFAEYIQKAPITDEEKMYAAGIIMAESKHMLNISDRLLELAILRNTDIPRKEVRIEELFENVKNLFMNKLKEANITLYYCNSIECFYGDLDLLESLLINITDNAIKACQPGGFVSWEACMTKGHKTLIVKDNGKGIPAEAIGKITDPFYRVDKSRSRANGGVGLGLCICGLIADLHHAELTFNSATYRGTTVKVTFANG